MTALSPLWTAGEVAAATDAQVVGRWAATGVSIDSRTVSPGDLFIALQGPNFDGHDFVAQALEAGAVAAMVHRPPAGVPGDAPLAVVEDTFEGLIGLARYGRLRCRAQVVAVTGSVGKTGTKEALRIALSQQGRTHASAGNLNNHWGVPLSVARLPADAAFAVFELGMNHAGEIRPLSELVKPDVAVITAVEAVHLENFEDITGIADAKAEIFAGMGPRGVVALPRDNPHYARLVAHARTQGIGRIWSFGEAADADARLVDCSLFATGSAAEAVVRGEPLAFAVPAPGRHWVVNSLAVLLAVRGLGADLVKAARSLTLIEPLAGRGRQRTIELGADGAALTLIDESYNASPASVAAAMAVLGRLERPSGGRRIAVLGDMLELGSDAPAMHAGLAGLLTANGVDLLFTCGSLMRHLADAVAPAMRGDHAADARALAPLVAAAVQPGDLVLVKGSLGSRMAEVITALDGLARPAAGTSERNGNPVRSRLVFNGG